MIVSLYIHIPFCLQKCHYCDFNSLAGSSIALSEYVTAILDEMRQRAADIDAPLAHTLYFGGGTPSLLPPDQVAQVINTAEHLYGLDSNAEITLEANPGTLTPKKAVDFRSVGVNRLSLGVQSFHDTMLTSLGRIHSGAEARHAFTMARTAGFTNIGIDLIHSLPGQTLAMWQDDLHEAIRLGPDHISAYGLSVEEGTTFHDLALGGKLELPDEEAAAEFFLVTVETLRKAGYEHYEISNFARPGLRSRHNQVYWQGENYLGFGAGAHSFLNFPEWGQRWENPTDPGTYINFSNSGKSFAVDHAPRSKREAMAEFLFLGLRMLEGICERDFANHFGQPITDAYGRELDRLLMQGLLERDEGRLRLSRQGLLLANQVFVMFV